MCRILYVKAGFPFPAQEFLIPFSEISKNSKEYQGHGWGCSFIRNNQWEHYKSITPVWEDDLSKFGKTNILLAHARSAFKDEGISVENNMPFTDGRRVFVFNGELRGVKIKSEGRIGAEKIFNFVRRFDKGALVEALPKAIDIIKKRTSYIRAMNFIIADMEAAYVYSLFNEDHDYFTMKYSESGGLMICSEALDKQNEWKEIQSGKLMIFK